MWAEIASRPTLVCEEISECGHKLFVDCSVMTHLDLEIEICFS